MRGTIGAVVPRVFVWCQSQPSNEQTTTNSAKLTTSHGLCPRATSGRFHRSGSHLIGDISAQTDILPAKFTTPQPSALTSHKIFNRHCKSRAVTPRWHSGCSLDLLRRASRGLQACFFHSSFLPDHQVHLIPAFLKFQVASLPQLHQNFLWLFQTFQIFIHTIRCQSHSKLLSSFPFRKLGCFLHRT